MRVHVKFVQIKLGLVRLEKVGKAVDHIRPSGCTFEEMRLGLGFIKVCGIHLALAFA
jgi:hypothetical protein